MWQSSTGLGGHSKQQTIHKMASSWRFPDSEWTHGHDHRHGWALGKQIVPQHVFGEDDENKRGFYMQIGILKVKSLNLGLWLYIIGFLIWVMGPFALAVTTCTFVYYLHFLACNFTHRPSRGRFTNAVSRINGGFFSSSSISKRYTINDNKVAASNIANLCPTQFRAPYENGI